MEQNIILAGVGGQGILSLAYVISQAALEKGLHIKQSEVHGMAQRGGAVQSHLRLSSMSIASDLIPKGRCDLLISVEPLESTRYLDDLSPDATIVTNTYPVKNICDYPEEKCIFSQLSTVANVIPVHADKLATKAGSSLAQNTVLLGAASVFLDLPFSLLTKHVTNVWKPKGDAIVQMNVTALNHGRHIAIFLGQALKRGATLQVLFTLLDTVSIEEADLEQVDKWLALAQQRIHT